MNKFKRSILNRKAKKRCDPATGCINYVYLNVYKFMHIYLSISLFYLYIIYIHIHIILSLLVLISYKNHLRLLCLCVSLSMCSRYPLTRIKYRQFPFLYKNHMHKLVFHSQSRAATTHLDCYGNGFPFNPAPPRHIDFLYAGGHPFVPRCFSLCVFVCMLATL